MAAFLSPGKTSLFLFLIFILFPKLNPFSPSNIQIFCFNKYSFPPLLSQPGYLLLSSPNGSPFFLLDSPSFFFSLEYKKHFSSLKLRIFLLPPFFNLSFIPHIVCFHRFWQYLILSFLSQTFIFVWSTLLSEQLSSLSNSPFSLLSPILMLLIPPNSFFPFQISDLHFLLIVDYFLKSLIFCFSLKYLISSLPPKYMPNTFLYKCLISFHFTLVSLTSPPLSPTEVSKNLFFSPHSWSFRILTYLPSALPSLPQPGAEFPQLLARPCLSAFSRLPHRHGLIPPPSPP